MSWHVSPQARHTPPDPRATVPLLLSAKNALHSGDNPSFPAPLAEQLRAQRRAPLSSPFEGWDLWLASGALPRNVHELKLHGGDWTAEISRDEDNELSRVSLNLSEKWESYEPIAEDPPTPGADLLDLLRRLPDDRLTSLWVDNLGELDDEGRTEVLREARRQRWLSELILPGEDGEPAPLDLSTGM